MGRDFKVCAAYCRQLFEDECYDSGLGFGQYQRRFGGHLGIPVLVQCEYNDLRGKRTARRTLWSQSSTLGGMAIMLAAA